MNSVIQWHRVADEVPDADTTVLIANLAWDQQIDFGWLDGRDWRQQEGAILNGSINEPEFLPPTLWAYIPDLPEVAE